MRQQQEEEFPDRYPPRGVLAVVVGWCLETMMEHASRLAQANHSHTAGCSETTVETERVRCHTCYRLDQIFRRTTGTELRRGQMDCQKAEQNKGFTVSDFHSSTTDCHSTASNGRELVVSASIPSFFRLWAKGEGFVFWNTRSTNHFGRRNERLTELYNLRSDFLRSFTSSNVTQFTGG